MGSLISLLSLVTAMALSGCGQEHPEYFLGSMTLPGGMCIENYAQADIDESKLPRGREQLRNQARVFKATYSEYSHCNTTRAKSRCENRQSSAYGEAIVRTYNYDTRMDYRKVCELTKGSFTEY